MTKTRNVLVAVVAFLSLASSAALATAPSPQTLTAPLAPWLVAQADRPRPTCESDNRKMPRGSIVCREGKQLHCGPYGNWVETGKGC